MRVFERQEFVIALNSEEAHRLFTELVGIAMLTRPTLEKIYAELELALPLGE